MFPKNCYILCFVFTVLIPVHFFFFTTIEINAQIEISSPKSGDTVISGRSIQICWEGANNSPVKLEFSTNLGLTWNIIADKITDNCYEWIPPPRDSENLRLKVTLDEVNSPRLAQLIKPAHLGEIGSVRFSENSKHFLSSGADSKVFLWDFELGKAIDSLIFPKTNRVFSAEFFHNIDTLLIAYDSTALIWLRKEKKLINLPKFSNIVRSVAVHPSENIFAVSSYSGMVKVYSYYDELLSINEIFSEDTSGIYNVRFSRNGQFLHFSDYYGNTVITGYPFTLNNFIGSYSAKNNKGNVVWSADLSYDSQFLASGGVDDSIRIWDIRKNELINTYDEHKFHIRTVNFYPDKYVCMSGSLDGYIRQWEIFTLDNFCEPIDNKGQVLSSDYSTDGKYIISSGRDSAIKIWRNCYRNSSTDSVRLILKNLIIARIPHLVSNPGKKISIPIIISNPSDYYLDKNIKFNVQVEIPSRLLQIRNQEFQIKKKISRKDTVNIEAEIKLLGSIDTIKALVLNGDRKLEEIRLLNFTPNENINIVIEKEDGSIKIEENCVGDYSRDVLFAVSALNMDINPNPSLSGIFNISLNIIEDGSHALDLVYPSGDYIRLAEIDLLAGYYSSQIDLSKYPFGFYFLRLISPNDEIVKKLLLL